MPGALVKGLRGQLPQALCAVVLSPQPFPQGFWLTRWLKQAKCLPVADLELSSSPPRSRIPPLISKSLHFINRRETNRHAPDRAGALKTLLGGGRSRSCFLGEPLGINVISCSLSSRVWPCFMNASLSAGDCLEQQGDV